jgi:hypothetical protein
MGNCWGWFRNLGWRRAAVIDPHSLAPLVGGPAPIMLLDRSLERTVDGDGFLMFSTKMSEGQAAYKVDLHPPFALRSAGGNIIAFLERVRTCETPHLLVLHGKADEFSTVNARDFSRYYHVRISSEAILTPMGKAVGLRHLGVLRGGLRSSHEPLCVLMNPPGEYSAEVAAMPM